MLVGFTHLHRTVPYILAFLVGNPGSVLQMSKTLVSVSFKCVGRTESAVAASRYRL